jgi:hypothetical protein
MAIACWNCTIELAVKHFKLPAIMAGGHDVGIAPELGVIFTFKGNS